jgi:hypothetical protein
MIKLIKIVLGIILVGYFIRIIQDGLMGTSIEQIDQMFWFASSYLAVDILNEIGDAVDKARS